MELWEKLEEECVKHWKVPPKDIDVLMGTFTKAFGSVGGYIAGKQGTEGFLKFQIFNFFFLFQKKGYGRIFT